MQLHRKAAIEYIYSLISLLRTLPYCTHSLREIQSWIYASRKVINPITTRKKAKGKARDKNGRINRQTKSRINYWHYRTRWILSSRTSARERVWSKFLKLTLLTQISPTPLEWNRYIKNFVSQLSFVAHNNQRFMDL